ncbi:MAG: inositol monophosphatase [Clostridia bacterium]|nr:inositol monophosphatase [Clostridia bacterium]
MANWKEQIPAMLEAIRSAGEIIRNAHKEQNVEDGMTVKPGEANFVTVFDVKVQNDLIGSFSALLPQANFMAEEKENSWEDLSKGLCFVIDPIDGTTNFIYNYGCSTISVGLYEDGEAVFAAVYNPYLDEMFTACKGEGVFCNGSPIHVSSAPFHRALVAFGTSPYYRETLGDVTFAVAKDIFMHTADVRRSGSAAWDLCCVAAGRIDGYYEAILSPWDYAAGQLLVKEAGGVVTQLDGSPLSPVEKSSVVAGSPAVQAELLRIAARHSR